MKKWSTWIIFTIIIALLNFFTQFPDKHLHIISCNVGQGDATLITQGFTQVLIDGGPGNKVLDCLSSYIPFWDKNIELVVLTHPQDDHQRGLVDVFTQYSVDTFIVNSITGKAKSFEKIKQLVLNNKIKIHSPKAGEIINVGQMSFKVLWPKEQIGDYAIWENTNSNLSKKLDNPITLDQLSNQNTNQEVLGDYSGDVNEVSVAIQLNYKDIKALFTGDIGTREEQALISSQLITDIDILKVAHHGSKYSSSSDFLRVVSPEFALISVGLNNRFNHPTSDTLMRLDIVNAKILRTDQIGHIELITNGEEIWKQ